MDLVWQETETFLRTRSGLLRVCSAPDSYPILADIPPPDLAAAHLAGVAAALGFEGYVPPVRGGWADTPLGAIEGLLQELIERRWQVAANVPGEGEVELVVLPLEAARALGPTLLQSVLNAGSRLIPPSPVPRASSVTTGAPMMAMAMRTVEVVPFRPGTAMIALAFDNGAPVIVSQQRDSRGWPAVAARRRLIEESVLGLPFAKLVVGFEGRGQVIPVSDIDAYRAARRADPNAAWSVRMGLDGILELLALIAEAVAAIHDSGIVHCDLKPANILVGAENVHCIDGLGLKPGDYATAATRGWAAPEQVLLEPVSPQTDQYPLGIMLLNALGGVLFGEEAQVTVPAGGTALERYTVFRNPGVFLDPETVALAPESISSWRQLIERCVRYEPGDRFPSAQEIANEIRENAVSLRYREPAQFSIAYGRPVTARPPDGNDDFAWLAGR